MKVAKTIERFNGLATLLWLALGYPTFVYWQESIVWVVAMSWWANVASHFAAWIASRAEVASESNPPQPGSEE